MLCSSFAGNSLACCSDRGSSSKYSQRELYNFLPLRVFGSSQDKIYGALVTFRAPLVFMAQNAGEQHQGCLSPDGGWVLGVGDTGTQGARPSLRCSPSSAAPQALLLPSCVAWGAVTRSFPFLYF